MKIIRRPYHHAGSCFLSLRRALPSYVCMKIDWIFMRSFTFCDRPTDRPTTGRGGQYSSLTENQWQTTRFYLDARAFAGKWGQKNWIAFGSIKIEPLRRLILFWPMTENNWVELGRYINKSVGPIVCAHETTEKKIKEKLSAREAKNKNKNKKQAIHRWPTCLSSARVSASALSFFIVSHCEQHGVGRRHETHEIYSSENRLHDDFSHFSLHEIGPHNFTLGAELSAGRGHWRREGKRCNIFIAHSESRAESECTFCIHSSHPRSTKKNMLECSMFPSTDSFAVIFCIKSWKAIKELCRTRAQQRRRIIRSEFMRLKWIVCLFATSFRRGRRKMGRIKRTV